MELPTYTSIWRIEKRLYKLYDFRLPMPLPVGQIAVFVAITVPYVILLTLLGLPFNHTLFWLYVLPPGVLTWLATRPVLESKRLPELIISQMRYLGEPASWCRMAPLAEKEEIVVVARVWRRGRPVTAAATAQAIAHPAAPGIARAGARADRPAIPAPAPGQAAALLRVPAGATPAGPRAAAGSTRGHMPAGQAVPAAPAPPAPPRPGQRPGPAPAAARAPAPPAAPGPVPASFGVPGPVAPAQHSPAQHSPAASSPVPAAAPAPSPPVVIVPAQRAAAGPPTVRRRGVERALSGPAGQRSASWRDHVVVVPGGLGPGRPDHDKRDRARAVLPVGGSRLVAVLGCTVGAGQTVTTLIVADLLASLRGESVAALDLNPGPASLAELAEPRPPMPLSELLAGSAVPGPADLDGLPGQPGSPRHATAKGRPPQPASLPRGQGRLDVIAPEVRGDGSLALGDLEYRRMLDAVAGRYQLAFADPGASAVARILTAADQLVLVAPASPDAARALAMTQEWLGSHGYQALTANSITVLNGLSKRSMPHAGQAELVVRGRCRAIVRVPWDDHLAEPQSERGVRDSLDPSATPSRLGQLRPPVLQAYTALAGVLVAALATSPQQRRAAQ